jgi:hypothetical protein
VPGAAGQPAGDIRRLLDIVQDQQPSLALVQRAQQRSPDRLHGRARCGAAQRVRQRGELFAEQACLFGVDPPHHLVLGGEPVGVLDRELRLPDATHAAQRLDHGVVP